MRENGMKEDLRVNDTTKMCKTIQGIIKCQILCSTFLKILKFAFYKVLNCVLCLQTVSASLHLYSNFLVFWDAT